jgi:hypothetical protein
MSCPLRGQPELPNVIALPSPIGEHRSFAGRWRPAPVAAPQRLFEPVDLSHARCFKGLHQLPFAPTAV